ncbi:MAG: sodium:solute symporter [Acidobacteria bacterium]|nr:sodium:solute symporter [Acidobacteriota bacterium]
MTSNLRWLDLAIVAGYMAILAGIGMRFSRRQTSTEAYFVARRSVPSWAMGLSLLATLISSITFVAYPGSAYGNDWSLLVPGFMVVAVLALVGTVIIPFYREAVGMSAYEYFGRRFGRPTRVYSSVAFTLAHFSKMGFVVYLLGLTINSMTGWPVDLVILIVVAVTIFYTVVGGLEAVIWTDVIQGFVIWVGVIVCLGYLLFLPPGGPAAVFRIAAEGNKFSLGSMAPDFSKPTIPVLIVYGFFWYLQRYVADQTLVQRYLAAKSDRGALKGISLGAGLCVPVWTLFMLIGTCTWAFYKLTGEKLPDYISKADQVFPYFLATHLPIGMAGLFMASLTGAAMSMLASDLNSLAVVGVEDFYRLLRPGSTDRQRLRLGKLIVAIFGVLAAGTAIVLAHTKGSALSMWFTVSAIASGGMAGLFLLAFLSRRANRKGVAAGIAACWIFTAWATLTLGSKRWVDLGPFNFPWHDYMIGACGHVILLTAGYLASLLMPDGSTVDERLKNATLWRWLDECRLRRAQAAVAGPQS